MSALKLSGAHAGFSATGTTRQRHEATLLDIELAFLFHDPFVKSAATQHVSPVFSGGGWTFEREHIAHEWLVFPTTMTGGRLGRTTGALEPFVGCQGMQGQCMELSGQLVGQ